MRFNDCLLDCAHLRSFHRKVHDLLCKFNLILCCAPVLYSTMYKQHKQLTIKQLTFLWDSRDSQKTSENRSLCHCNLHAFRMHLCHCCTRRRCSSAACSAGINRNYICSGDIKGSIDMSNNDNVSCLGGDFVVGLFSHP